MDKRTISAYKIAVDLVLISIPAIIALILNLFVTPFQRNFFCNDESIMYPFKTDTISILSITLVGIIFSILLIVVIELILKFSNSYEYDEDNGKETKTFRNWKVPPFIQNLYQYIGLLLFGMSINQFLTDGTKFAVGRLRPHFMDVCQPQLPDGSNCNDVKNWNQYISDYECTNQDATSRMLHNMRLSFPSGHSSFAFYCGFFCVFYIQSRMKYRGSKILKHFIQLIFVSGALYTGLSRISDYKHHPTDVLAGGFLGTFIAFLICFYLSDLFKRKMMTVLPR